MKKMFFFILILFFIALHIYSENSRTEIVQKLFKSIEDWFGTKYILGGNTKNGIDCSGFVAQVYKEVFKITLPRSVKDQRKMGKIVSNTLQPGDLLFFKINDTISHVGIYVFNNKFIHAASSGPSIGVTKSSLNEKYYKSRYVFAKRIITLPPYEKSQNKKIENKKTQNKTPIIKNNNLVTFGKVLFRGKLFELSNDFSVKNPIYFHLKNENKQSNRYKINFINENSKKDNFELIITNAVEKNIFKKVYLKKGSYTVKVYSKNKILSENKIKVN